MSDLIRRASKFGRVLALAVSTILILTGSGVQAGTLEDAIDRGYIEIAIGNAPPWAEMTADGEVTGAAPDVTVAVLKRLGIPEVRASVIDYGAMIPGLHARRFDVVAAGLFMNPQRCEAVAFSIPDVCGTEAFAVPKGNPMNLMSFEDVASSGAKIVVCGGCAEEKMAKEAGVSANNIIIAPDEQSAVKLISDGRADVLAYPTISLASLFMKVDLGHLEIVSPVQGVPIGCAGAAFRKEDADFRDAYDAVLRNMQTDGTFAELLGKYGFDSTAAVEASRETLCGAAN